MTIKYAIETIGLVKRYPTSARREGAGGGFGGGRGGGSVDSFGGILGMLRGRKGSFIVALRGIDLQIKEGEVFGLLGPNGAGKTTLLKVLCTLVIHDEGEAYVHGFDVKKKPTEVIKNLQAVLPESRGFNWRLTGRQNLLAGVSFPVVYLDTIFFPGVSTISWFLPQTWVYHLCRLAMLTNPSLLDPKILFEFLKGAIFALILLPVGYRILRWGVNRSKREGTLGWLGLHSHPGQRHVQSMS